MADCFIEPYGISNAMVTWTPVGEITGFAEDEMAVGIALDGGTENSMKVSADGLSGTLGTNAKTNGEATLKIVPGSPFVGILNRIFTTAKGTMGTMTVQDIETGEAWVLGCAAMKSMPEQGRGTTAPDSYDFVFLFANMEYTASSRTVNAMRVA